MTGNKYLLYPGCSMESSAIAYDESLTKVAEVLDLELEEINDWNCCGATEYLGISLTPAYALISRNLALASQQANGNRTVVAPCSACYLNLAKADYYMQEQPKLGKMVNEALAAGGLSYKPGTLEIRHLLDVMVYDIGLDTIASKVVRPLKGLRVAPYLGCMVPRPDYEHRWSDHEHPVELDLLLQALGAEVIDFPLKTHCCGGHMTQIGPDTAFELIRRLVSSAETIRSRYHGHRLPDVPDEPGCLPERNQPALRHQFQDANRVLHPVDGIGLRLGAKRAWLRYGTGQRQEGPGKNRTGSTGTGRCNASTPAQERRVAHAETTPIEENEERQKKMRWRNDQTQR